MIMVDFSVFQLMRMHIGSANRALFIILHLLKLQANTAYGPDGYIGCFKDSRNRVLNEKKTDFDPNSGKRCKQFCREHGYRYAGTESEEQCFCGNKIRYKRPAYNCDYECEGNPSELCGGAWRISIYDTWHCATKPCQNGATCRDKDVDHYSCICTENWTGIHCDKPQTTVQSTSTTTETTTQTTTTKTTTITAVNTKTSTASGKSTEGTSRESMTNVTDIPHIKPTDDHSDSMIAMYVLLPLGVIVIMIIAAFVLKRRRQRKKETVSEIICHGPGSTPNIYANVINAPQRNQFEQEGQSHNQSREESARLGKEFNVIDEDRRGTVEQEMEEYNTLTLPSNNRTVLDYSYDHVVKPASYVEKTYSILSAVQLNREHMSVDNTYSHIENASGQDHVSGIAEKDDNTYNTLELRANRKAEGTGGRIEDCSFYDHTNTRQTDERVEDCYSHMNTTIAHPNDDDKNRNIGIENIYYNEDEYATVEKVSKN
ncbi:uncharacterized protein LOC123551724 [Mercenaria mercenaria]|uniref:uncharacterized protein LOC123551724 n=1 Tax=Mercenaria mercenaria TaxID=6596 RepID=UPI00234ED331|nr:uncharacterized protein LOC123551724 [Mercenaria mercenaria]